MTPTSPGRAVAVARWTGAVVLAVVAMVAAVLSWSSLSEAASLIWGPRLALAFPLLVDALIVGSALIYVAGVRAGVASDGWRLTAHAAAGGTVVLNAMTATTAGEVIWHVTPPLVLAALVELTRAELSRQRRALVIDDAPVDRIPGRLWVHRPVSSLRVWLHMAASGTRSHIDARAELARWASADDVLRRVLRGAPGGRRVRRQVMAQVRDRALDPAVILAVIGWAPGWSGDRRRAAEALSAAALIDHPAPVEVPAVASLPPVEAARIAPDVACPTPDVSVDDLRQGVETVLGPTSGAEVPVVAPEASPAAVLEAPGAPLPALDPAPAQARVAVPAASRSARPRPSTRSAPTLPSGTKRAAVELALSEAGYRVPEALELLRQRAVEVSRGYVYQVARRRPASAHVSTAGEVIDVTDAAVDAPVDAPGRPLSVVA